MRPLRCRSCRGTLWTDDECWQPEDYLARAYALGEYVRTPRDGLIPCGACNFAGWANDPREPDRPVRALSVREPWASAIVLGYKDTENRSVGFATGGYLGPVLIHAAKAWVDDADGVRRDPRLLEAFSFVQGGQHRSHGWALRHGETARQRPPWPFAQQAIVGYAELVDNHEEQGGCCEPWGETTYVAAGGDRVGGVRHLRFEDAEALPVPISASGALGLWKPDDDLVDLVESQIAAAA